MSGKLRISLVGQTFPASRTVQRARALRRLGHDVRVIPITPEGNDYETRPSLATRIRYRLRLPADPAHANQAIVAAAPESDILWLEAAGMVTADALGAAKQANPKILVVCYSEDDMMNPRHRSRQQERSFSLIDLWATTKSFNLDPGELPAMGLRALMFVDNGFDPDLHRPIETAMDTPIGFIGTYEAPRARSLTALAEAGLPVRVWGNGWSALAGRQANLTVEGRPIYNDDYVRAIRATRINLCFLRHGNRDRQTCRSVEIPACGGFMAHEASDEAAALFRAGSEAVYFDSDDALIALCRSWLDRDAERASIGEAARQRALSLGLAHDDIVAAIVERLMQRGSGSPT